MTPESLKEENSNIAINTSHFKTTLDNMKTVSLQAHLKQLVISVLGLCKRMSGCGKNQLKILRK